MNLDWKSKIWFAVRQVSAKIQRKMSDSFCSFLLETSFPNFWRGFCSHLLSCDTSTGTKMVEVSLLRQLIGCLLQSNQVQVTPGFRCFERQVPAVLMHTCETSAWCWWHPPETAWRCRWWVASLFYGFSGAVTFGFLLTHSFCKVKYVYV